MRFKEKFQELMAWANSLGRRLFRKHALRQRKELHDYCVKLDINSILDKKLLAGRYVVLDLETTGLSAYAGDEIVSIAMLEYKGLKPTGNQFISYINPNRSIPISSTRIHGITDANVTCSPSVDSIIDDIVEFIGDAVVVGHHISFDIRFLNKATQKNLYCGLRNPCLDTMLLYLSHSGRIGHYTLEELAEFTGVEIHARHTALGDATATGEIFHHLCELLHAKSMQIRELIDFQNQASQHHFHL